MASEHTYKVWYDHNETWDPNDIDPPAEIEADSVYEAACRFAERDWRINGDNFAEIIVLDEHGQYTMVEVRREWSVKRSRQTSLAELCDEEGEAAL